MRRKLTSKRDQDGCGYKMHMRDSIYELRTRQDHRRTTEDITAEVQDHEYNVTNLAIPHSDDFERGVSIWHSYLGHHTQCSHQCNLEAQTSCPPLEIN